MMDTTKTYFYDPSWFAHNDAIKEIVPMKLTTYSYSALEDDGWAYETTRDLISRDLIPEGHLCEIEDDKMYCMPTRALTEEDRLRISEVAQANKIKREQEHAERRYKLYLELKGEFENGEPV